MFSFIYENFKLYSCFCAVFCFLIETFLRRKKKIFCFKKAEMEISLKMLFAYFSVEMHEKDNPLLTFSL